MRLATGTVADFTSAQFGDQWSMPRKHPDVAVAPGYLRFISGFSDDQLFWSHNFELESIGHVNQASYVVRRPQNQVLCSSRSVQKLTSLSRDQPRSATNDAFTPRSSSFRKPRVLPRLAPSYRTPVRECHRACLRRSP